MSIVSNIEEQRIAVTNSYTVQQNLPALSDPAAVADVLDGKEFLDDDGTIKAGTLVICDEVEDRSANGVNGVGLTVGIGSRKDGSQSELSIAQTSIAAGNIKSGVSIFGINGSVREVTTASGTVTPAADTIPLLIPTPYEAAKLLVVRVNAVAELATKTEKCFIRVTWQGVDIDASFFADAVSFGYNTASPSTPYKGLSVAVNRQGNIEILGIANWKFPAGVQYNWTVYYWD